MPGNWKKDNAIAKSETGRTILAKNHCEPTIQHYFDPLFNRKNYNQDIKILDDKAPNLYTTTYPLNKTMFSKDTFEYAGQYQSLAHIVAPASNAIEEISANMPKISLKFRNKITNEDINSIEPTNLTKITDNLASKQKENSSDDYEYIKQIVRPVLEAPNKTTSITKTAFFRKFNFQYQTIGQVYLMVSWVPAAQTSGEFKKSSYVISNSNIESLQPRIEEQDPTFSLLNDVLSRNDNFYIDEIFIIPATQLQFLEYQSAEEDPNLTFPIFKYSQKTSGRQIVFSDIRHEIKSEADRKNIRIFGKFLDKYNANKFDHNSKLFELYCTSFEPDLYSKMISITEKLKTYYYLEQTTRTYFTNNASFGSVLNFKHQSMTNEQYDDALQASKKITEEEARRIKNTLSNASADQAGRDILNTNLNYIMEFSPYPHSFEEERIILLKRNIEAEIYETFGSPNKDVKYETEEKTTQRNIQIHEKGVFPVMERYCQLMNEICFNAKKRFEHLQVYYKEGDLPALLDKKLKNAVLLKQTGAAERNEIREVIGYEADNTNMGRAIIADNDCKYIDPTTGQNIELLNPQNNPKQNN